MARKRLHAPANSSSRYRKKHRFALLAAVDADRLEERLCNAFFHELTRRTTMSGRGTFIWNELNTHDARKACEFYSSLLGWRFEEMPMPDGVYRIAKLGDNTVAGLFEMKGKDFEGVPPHWLSYIEVDDIDNRVTAAKQAGATMIREPFDVEGVGRIAILKDAIGALIAWM